MQTWFPRPSAWSFSRDEKIGAMPENTILAPDEGLLKKQVYDSIKDHVATGLGKRVGNLLEVLRGIPSHVVKLAFRAALSISAQNCKDSPLIVTAYALSLRWVHIFQRLRPLKKVYNHFVFVYYTTTFGCCNLPQFAAFREMCNDSLEDKC